MNCTRCQGTMVTDYLLDMEESGDVWASSWRCLMCGEVVDSTILKHREAQECQGELVGAVSKETVNDAQPPVAVLSPKS